MFQAVQTSQLEFPTWSNLKDAVLEGGDAFSVTHGETLYEHLASDRGRDTSEMFNQLSISKILTSKILTTYSGFKDVKQLVDVGGGLGHNVGAIVSKYPSIKGINFDLPYVTPHGLPIPGVEHVSGDMFVRVPQGDAIFLKWVLHNWSDELCLKLLKNCYASLPESGKVIVVEAVLSMSPETSMEAKTLSQLDVTMMAALPMGKERTREEFIALSNAAGFLDIKFVVCVSCYWIIELYK